jgi:beta-glucosidase
MNPNFFIYRMLLGLAISLLLSCSSENVSRQKIENEVERLLAQLTLAEKIDLVSGNGFGTKPIPRLGIPSIQMTDGPLGPNRNRKATHYSACINWAATWDVDLIGRVGAGIGQETWDAGCGVILAPCVNIARVPHGGRTFEGFGEDPWLVSRMAVAYIQGVQKHPVSTCVKHYAVNNQEWNRGYVSVEVGERALREIYLPAFQAAVQEAEAGSIMAAYNRFRGVYCCENKYLLTDILKDEWGFQGVALSDWGGVSSTVPTALAGLDLEMPDGKYLGPDLARAVAAGEVPVSLIDDKVQRILRLMVRFGLFQKSASPDSLKTDYPEHRQLALDVARKSIVLLKNEKNLLPLNLAEIKSVAVMGPNAEEAALGGGGSGALDSDRKISPLQGIQEKWGSQIEVYFTRGVSHPRSTLPPIETQFLIPAGATGNPHGLKAEYFNNRDVSGAPVLTRIDPNVNFNWKTDSPAPGVVNLDAWSVRWTGQLVAPGTGLYEIGANADNGVRVFLNDCRVVDSWTDAAPDKLKSGLVNLTAGEKYALRVEFYENRGEALAILGLAPQYLSRDEIEKAVNLSQKTDVAILCVGLNKELEGEAYDRKDLNLPAEQVELIRAVAAVNPKTLVVLFNASPVLMNAWQAQTPVILEAFYPGQEGGHALAEILVGAVNPSGKLPLTLPQKWEDCPAYASYPGAQELADYTEGIFVGYRHFDRQKIDPNFPFGHGLSYTTFEYQNLKISPAKIKPEESVSVKFKLTNTGDRDGDEVVQLYLRDVTARLEREDRALKAFKRVHLDAGESRTVEFELAFDALKFYDAELRLWVAEPGKFEVLIGRSSRDIRLQGEFEY